MDLQKKEFCWSGMLKRLKRFWLVWDAQAAGGWWVGCLIGWLVYLVGNRFAEKIFWLVWDAQAAAGWCRPLTRLLNNLGRRSANSKSQFFIFFNSGSDLDA